MSGSLSSPAGGPRERTPLPARCCECPGVPLLDEEGGTCCRCGKYLASDLANTSRQDPDHETGGSMNETAGTKIDEGYAYVGFDPACEKWEVLRAGRVHVDDGEDGIQTVRYPGWHMRSSTGVQLWTDEQSYVRGPAIAGQLQIGGYTVPELQEIA